MLLGQLLDLGLSSLAVVLFFLVLPAAGGLVRQRRGLFLLTRVRLLCRLVLRLRLPLLVFLVLLLLQLS